MSDGLYVDPGMLEASGRTSYRSADEAEGVQRTLRGVVASSGSYGGATEFVSSFNGARELHVRGAESAAEGRDAMGDGDRGAAAHALHLDAAATFAVSGPTVADPGISDAF
ncbi:hypothetical protein [Streptomyces bohaiensis]|uniref:Uncharacterized protein n=1 Tax=Streptomyces bohaiensis TaxID=1431344 RepID=A0ABX1CET0_9ACTN|nr:hypothetical protein [Streptomyces bohaiensis]NJQ15714.1 hypothetical protein [Streptomyces bohaiensis]